MDEGGTADYADGFLPTDYMDFHGLTHGNADSF
jgi:hypothetical protein